MMNSSHEGVSLAQIRRPMVDYRASAPLTSVIALALAVTAPAAASAQAAAGSSAPVSDAGSTRATDTIDTQDRLSSPLEARPNGRLAQIAASLGDLETQAIAPAPQGLDPDPVQPMASTATARSPAVDEPLAGEGLPKSSAVEAPKPTSGRRNYNVPQRFQADTVEPKFEWVDQPASVPLALVEAVKIVTQRDPAALAAWSNARASLAGVTGAKWLRFPSLSADVSLARQENRLTAPNTVAPSVGVDLPLWTGGRIRSTIRRAQRIEYSSIASWQETVLALALQVTDTYFQIVLNTRLQSLYRNSLVEHQSLVGTMERRVAQEVSPLADLELARSRAAQIEQELNIIGAQRSSALRVLAELVRDPSYQLGPMPRFSPEMPLETWVGAEEEAMTYSPTRSRLLYDSDAAYDQINIVRSTLFPQLSAQVSYNQVNGTRVGVGLRVQTGNGLSQLSDIAAAKARFDAASSQISLFERQLRQEIATEIITYEAAVRRARVSRGASETAQRVSESYKRQFIAGRRSWLDVMNALRESLSAQAGLAQTELTALGTSARLNLRSGRWSPEYSAGKR